MKVNKLVVAIFLANSSSAVQVDRFLSPLNYFIKQSSLAQTGSKSHKFMSITGQLDNENTIENS